MVVPDLHNTCLPEPPPFVMALNFGVQILQQTDEVILSICSTTRYAMFG